MRSHFVWFVCPFISFVQTRIDFVFIYLPLGEDELQLSSLCLLLISLMRPYDNSCVLYIHSLILLLLYGQTTIKWNNFARTMSSCLNDFYFVLCCCWNGWRSALKVTVTFLAQFLLKEELKESCVCIQYSISDNERVFAKPL